MLFRSRRRRPLRTTTTTTPNPTWTSLPRSHRPASCPPPLFSLPPPSRPPLLLLAALPSPNLRSVTARQASLPSVVATPTDAVRPMADCWEWRSRVRRWTWIRRRLTRRSELHQRCRLRRRRREATSRLETSIWQRLRSGGGLHLLRRRCRFGGGRTRWWIVPSRLRRRGGRRGMIMSKLFSLSRLGGSKS